VTCALLGERKRSTHRVSDEIFQGSSLNILGYQIEPLVLVEHADELQHVGVLEASHHFDLKIRQKQLKNKLNITIASL